MEKEEIGYLKAQLGIRYLFNIKTVFIRLLLKTCAIKILHLNLFNRKDGAYGFLG
jgi:hypothetical protein